MPTVHQRIAPDESETDPPVKAIDRAARLLRALASHPFDGATFTDLARDTDFGKATTHRLLAALIDVGFVFQEVATKRYRLGSAFTLLGRNATTQLITTATHVPLEQIASETGDTVFASVPEGTAAVCIARATGSFPIRTLTLNVGDRRPLGVGSGSLALLAAMSDDEIGKVIDRNDRWLRDYPGYTPDALVKMVAETRRNGFAFNAGLIVPGMCAIGVPVLDASRRPIASLSAAAITERMATPRAEKLAKLLKREAKSLCRQIAEAGQH